jgi:uncharacterized small protein (DUF1192 family)
MNKENKKEQLQKRLHKMISKYLDNKVTRPLFETIDKDLLAQAQLADLLVVVKIIIELGYKEGIEIDKDFLRVLSKKEIEKRINVFSNFIKESKSIEESGSDPVKKALEYLFEDSSRKYLLAFLNKEINWIVISILSASYVSSLILMRAVFELIIGIASKSTGSMRYRIDSVACLNDKEKSGAKKLWDRLCAWGHPYGKWIKEICPIYTDQEPIYHPKLCKICLQELEKIVDLFVVVAMARYDIETTRVAAKMREANISSKKFKLLDKRLSS